MFDDTLKAFSSRRHILAAAAAGTGSLLLGSAGKSHAANAAGNDPADGDGVGTIWWVELVTANDVTAADHYGAIMSWTTRRMSMEDSSKPATAGEPAYTLFVANGSDVAGAAQATASDPVKNKPMWIVYFRVDSVEKAIGRALNKGGRLLLAPYEVPNVARMALLADLDGLTYGVATPL